MDLQCKNDYMNRKRLRLGAFTARSICASNLMIACFLFGFLSWPAAQQNSDVLPPSTFRLELQRQGDQVTISYPVAASDYTLESADSLVPPTRWSEVAEKPIPNGDRLTVTWIETSASRYFRLRKPGDVSDPSSDPDHAAHHP